MAMSNAARLVGIGFAYPLAAYLGAAIEAGVADFRRIMELGVPPRLAQAIADAINGEDFSAKKFVSLGMNAEQARILASVIGSGGAGQGAAFVFADDSNGIARRAYADNSDGLQRFVTADKEAA